MNDLHTFFASRHFAELPENNARHPKQIGPQVKAITEYNTDWRSADIILVGCGECRGSEGLQTWSHGADTIREAFYRMYSWHPSIMIADMGNILEGATISDTRAALRTVLSEIKAAGKVAVVLGGSHDLTLQQYDVFRNVEQTINVAVIDMLIDLEDTENISDQGFLMDMLTGQPNFVRHFSQIGFQSYYTNPGMLETLDKLRFDCFRLGRVREQLEEMEPVLRNCDLLSVDINALRYSDAPFLRNASPNGFFGDELCQLLRYGGMSSQLSSLGIYGYHPQDDPDQQGAQLIAQMLWYFIDGYWVRKHEADLQRRTEFLEFHLHLSDIPALFLKSKKTNRWWMQLPDGEFVPCSYNDYLQAAQNEIPERWLRELERIV